MSVKMKDIEREVGTKMYAILSECQAHLLSAIRLVDDVSDSPLVGNGLRKALLEYKAELDKLSNRHAPLYDIVREKFGVPDNVEVEK